MRMLACAWNCEAFSLRDLAVLNGVGELAEMRGAPWISEMGAKLGPRARADAGRHRDVGGVVHIAKMVARSGAGGGCDVDSS